ncbi:MAG: hypothetical protein AUJ48_02465 [Deltaproteobacteria bacterium CG1_02_45_11]|nr:MAG: hypothetical protein AUJ48_02465 [Deltaproteobacteria bacterium CG1_02_45_11]
MFVFIKFYFRKWLKAGLLEKGKHLSTEEGTTQGGSVRSLLGDIYLHYVLDLWAGQWRHKQLEGFLATQKTP